MAPGRPYPPSPGEYPIARQIGRRSSWSAARTRNRIRCRSFVERESRGIMDHAAAGFADAHSTPAACLKSGDRLRSPMSRTIDSGSDRKCT